MHQLCDNYEGDTRLSLRSLLRLSAHIQMLPVLEREQLVALLTRVEQASEDGGRH